MRFSNEKIEKAFKQLELKMMRKKDIEAIIENGENVCINCGCTDSRACSGGCSWIDIDTISGFGICSAAQCESYYLNNCTQGGGRYYE